MRALGRIVATGLTLGSIYVLAVALAPTLQFRVPGTTRMLIAQAVSFPALMLAGTALLGLLALGQRLAARRDRLLRILTDVSLVACLASAAAWSGVLPPSTHPIAAGTTASVATFNTEGDLTADVLQQLIADASPDVVVLPETSAATLDAALPRPLSALYDRWTSGTTGDTAPTSVLARRDLGYAATAAPQASYGAIRLVSTKGWPDIIAAHPAPPVPGLMDAWRTEVPGLLDAAGCHAARPAAPAARPAILAGDLNSAPTHGTLSDLGTCIDVQAAVGNRWDHTWPTSKPAWAGTTIDHVITTPGVRPVSARVVRYAVSDHRALLTRVSF